MTETALHQDQAPAAGGGWVGRSVPRREDLPLLLGQARFIDDLAPFPGTREAAILRSPHAHARLVSIDVTAALEMKGVHAVVTGADIAALTKPIPNAVQAPIRQYPIAVDHVHYAGEPVAVIVADDRYLAEDAMERVAVIYDELPVCVDPLEAARDEVAIHAGAPSNIVHERSFRFGDPERAFAEADRIVSIEVDYPRITSTPIETYGVIARFDPAQRSFEIWSNFQGPFIGHPIIAGALGVRPASVRMISAPASGGSFGVKWGVFAYAILLAAVARAAGMPVKWIEDRAEHLAAASSSTGRHTRMEGAFSSEGQLLGLKVDQLENIGAYVRPPEPSTLYRTHGNLNGPYDVRDIAVHNRVVLTHQAPSGLNRGFGAPQYYFPLERLMHEAASQLGIDPLELRMRNLVSEAAMPYKCASGGMLDGGDYPATLRQAAGLAGYDALVAERDAARANGELAGIGIAVSVESSASSLAYVNAALTPEQRAASSDKSGGLAVATLSADAGGAFTLRLPTVPAGQGHATVLAQLVADEIGLNPDEINVVTAIDTAFSDWSITSGNYANRFSGADTTAAVFAARKVAAKLRIMAGAALGCPPEEIELVDGVAREKDRNSHIAIRKLAAWSHWNSSNMPAGLDGGIQETGVFTPTSLQSPDKEDRVRSSLTSTLMCDIAAVRIDRETGQVSIRKYAVVHDVGRILNPAIVEGQLRGGLAHGLGAALMERIEYDAGGNLLTGTFMDYLCPLADDMPEVLFDHASHPTTENATGARGLGDGASMNAPICIANALADAMASAEVSIPASPSRLWSLLNGRNPDERPERKVEASTGDPAIRGMLTGEGAQQLPGQPARVWAALFAVDELAKIIPGCRSLIEVEPDRFEAEIVLSVAGMRSTYHAKIELTDKDEPRAIRIAGRADGKLGFGMGEAFITLAPSGETTTQLTYHYRADVGGRIAGVGQRMLDSVVRLLIRQFFAGLTSHLDPSSQRPSMLARLGDALRGLFPKGGR